MRDSCGVGIADFETETNELLRVLDDLSHLLSEWDETRWAEWLERDRALIADGHPDALRHLLGAFGGVGSLRDLSIHPGNGHTIEEDRIRPVNDRLRVLVGAVHTQATNLRDLESEQ
jgi:hypothetical protein